MSQRFKNDVSIEYISFFFSLMLTRE